MRIISLFRKTWIENIRDWKILILTLTFAPLFVLLMYFYVGESTQSPYRVVVINRDVGVSTADHGDFNAGSDLILEMTRVQDSEGKKIIEVKQALDMTSAREVAKILQTTARLPVVLQRWICMWIESRNP